MQEYSCFVWEYEEEGLFHLKQLGLNSFSPPSAQIHVGLFVLKNNCFIF